jgi:hypothetical protein
MPAKAGIQNYLKTLDSRLRGNDVKGRFKTFYESIKILNVKEFISVFCLSSFFKFRTFENLNLEIVSNFVFRISCFGPPWRDSFVTTIHKMVAVKLDSEALSFCNPGLGQGFPVYPG